MASISPLWVQVSHCQGYVRLTRVIASISPSRLLPGNFERLLLQFLKMFRWGDVCFFLKVCCLWFEFGKGWMGAKMSDIYEHFCWPFGIYVSLFEPLLDWLCLMWDCDKHFLTICDNCKYRCTSVTILNDLWGCHQNWYYATRVNPQADVSSCSVMILERVVSHLMPHNSPQSSWNI